MTFQELEIGSYFCIPGMNSTFVCRKASSSHCSHNALLQPIRSETTVIPLTPREVTNYFAKKREAIKSLIN
jgi:hypothetical protein